MSTQRLQKILADAGFGSRRKCEEFITDGKVYVNSELVRSLGAKADPGRDEIICNDRIVRLQKRRYFAYYKPKGIMSTAADEYGRKTIFDIFPLASQLHLRLVGRLDRDSEGLIIFTNDGEFANRIAHPRFSVDREYSVTVAGILEKYIIAKIERGIWLSEGKLRPAKVLSVHQVPRSKITNLRIVVKEGKKREIRRMFARFNLKVLRLVRTRFGNLKLENMKPGTYREVRREDILEGVVYEKVNS